MRTLEIKLTGMPPSLKRAPLVGELLPVLYQSGPMPVFDQTESQVFLVAQDSPETVELDDREYLVRAFTFRGPVRSQTVVASEGVSEIKLNIEPEDVIAPLFPDPLYRLGPPESLRLDLYSAKPSILRAERPDAWDTGARTMIIEPIEDGWADTTPLLKFRGINVPSRLVFLPPLTRVLLSLFGLTNETAVQHRGGEYDPLGFRTVILSGGPESLLRYLQAGDARSAGLVADKIIRELERETKELLTAVLTCGYFSLVSQLHEESWNRLREFCEKLSDESADAAVIMGWHYWLDNDFERARRYWIKAADNGQPPIFSRGLKLLYDGLRTEPKCEGYARRIEKLAACADWSQTFTSLYGDSLDNLDPRWLYEI